MRHEAKGLDIRQMLDVKQIPLFSSILLEFDKSGRKL